MIASPLLDPTSAALVLLGTLLATLMRCGWADTRAALCAVAQLFTPRFDAVHARAELAAQVEEIREDGLVRAEPHHFGDGEFDEMADELIRTRSLQAAHKRHQEHRARRMDSARRVVGVLNCAAELAPVLGLAGTLVSLGGLSAAAAANGDFAGAIGMAVATTLCGLVTANFVFAPLAAITLRRAEAEDRAREELSEWLSAAIEVFCRRQLEPEPERSAA